MCGGSVRVGREWLGTAVYITVQYRHSTVQYSTVQVWDEWQVTNGQFCVKQSSCSWSDSSGTITVKVQTLHRLFIRRFTVQASAEPSAEPSA